MARILVVDDEDGVRKTLRQLLEYEGHEVHAAASGGEGLTEFEAFEPDVTFLDVKMARMDGLEVLDRIRKRQDDALVVMISGHGTIDTAVEATKHGAMAFLEKPITLQKLLRAVEQALARPGARPAAAAREFRHDGELAGEPLMMNSTGHAQALPLPIGPQSEQSFDLDRPLREARDTFEKSYFEFHLAQENGSMTRVAEKTGLERTHLYRKLKQLGVDLSRNKRGTA